MAVRLMPIDLYVRTSLGYHLRPSHFTRRSRPMRKLLPVFFTFLTLAAAPGCCVLELHPIPWMAVTKPPRAAPIDDHLDRALLVNVAQSPAAAGS